jgi:hypothetical protein
MGMGSAAAADASQSLCRAAGAISRSAIGALPKVLAEEWI